MGFLTRQDIIEVNDREIRELNVPEWHGDVRVRTLSGKERDAFEISCVSVNKRGQQQQNYENLRARLVALCLVDADGERLFRSTKEDIELLGSKAVAGLDRIFGLCQEMNGMSQKDVEDLTESFELTPGEDSTSD